MSTSPSDTSDSSESDNEGDINSSPIKSTRESNPETVRIEPLQIEQEESEIHSKDSFSIYKKLSVTLLLVSFLFLLAENGLGIFPTQRESTGTVMKLRGKITSATDNNNDNDNDTNDTKDTNDTNEEANYGVKDGVNKIDLNENDINAPATTTPSATTTTIPSSSTTIKPSSDPYHSYGNTPTSTTSSTTTTTTTISPQSPPIEICNAMLRYRTQKLPNNHNFLWYTPPHCNDIVGCAMGRCADENACEKGNRWVAWCEWEMSDGSAMPTTTTAKPVPFSGDGHKTAALCLKGNFYGRNSNRMITIANALRFSKNGIVWLDRAWSKWFLTWFDIKLTKRIHLATELTAESRDNGQSCQVTDSFTMFYKYSGTGGKNRDYMGAFKSEILALHFRPIYLQNAQTALDEYKKLDQKGLGRTVTVHSRSLEGECVLRVSKSNTMCMGQKGGYKDSCKYTYDWIVQHLPIELKDAPIILLGDGQLPNSEATFKIQDTHSYEIQFVMMTLSTYHFGNPASSVDYIVNHLRRGKPQYPETCYGTVSRKSLAANRI